MASESRYHTYWYSLTLSLSLAPSLSLPIYIYIDLYIMCIYIYASTGMLIRICIYGVFQEARTIPMLGARHGMSLQVCRKGPHTNTKRTLGCYRHGLGSV